MGAAVAVRMVDDNDSRAEALSGWNSQRQLAKIYRGNRFAAVIENSDESRWCLGQSLQSQERNYFNHAAGIEGITVFAELEEQKQHENHDEFPSLNRATLV
jgi:hypothetical protein